MTKSSKSSVSSSTSVGSTKGLKEVGSSLLGWINSSSTTDFVTGGGVTSG